MPGEPKVHKTLKIHKKEKLKYTEVIFARKSSQVTQIFLAEKKKS